MNFLSWTSVKSSKIIITETSGNFSCSVRSEVKADNWIAIFDSCKWLAIFLNNCRNNELISLSGCIWIAYCTSCTSSFITNALCKCLVCCFNSVPSVISVHRIITTHDWGNLTYADFVHLVIKLVNEIFSSVCCRITSIHKTVNIYIFKTISLCKLKKCKYMCKMAVNATVWKKSIKM